MKFASVGHDIFVSDYDYCDQKRWPTDPEGRACVHIWHPYHEGRGMCQWTTGITPDGADNLFLEYADAQPLTTARVAGQPVSLDAFADFVREPRPLLIHCAAGLTRSPTWAVLAKVVRGCDFWEAITEVTSSLRNQYVGEQWPMFFGEPLKDIYEWWLNRRGCGRELPRTAH